MFGLLKKKLKESVEKISNVVKAKEDHPTIEDIAEKVDEVVHEKLEEISLESVERKKTLEELEAEILELEKKLAIPEDILEKPIEEKTEVVEKNEEEVKEKVMEDVKEIVDELEKEDQFVEDIKISEELEKEIKPEIVREIKIEPKKEGIFKKIKKKITEKELKESDVKDILWDLQISLVQSDVALEVAEKIIKDLENNLIGQSVSKNKIDDIVKSSLKDSVKDILNVKEIDLLSEVKTKKPYLITFIGFNGSGKTTSIARVGYLLKQAGFSVVFAAADTWRAASIEQLEEHGNNLGINVIKQKYGSDPAAVIFDAVKHAKSKGIDIVLADTAGRSHANVNLIEELKKIVRVNTPDMKILVMDALTGNDVVDQTSMFNEAVGVDALILTKTDVYEKGGAILSSVHNIKKPILYLGVGQDYKDLKKFDSDEIVKNLME